MYSDNTDNTQNPDEYLGWRLLNGTETNTTMKQILTDTSGSWNCTDYGYIRVYRRNGQQGCF